MQLFHIINTESFPHGFERRRVWLEPNQPIWIARRLFMQIQFDRLDDEYVPVIRLSGPGIEAEFPIPASTSLYAHDWAGLVVTPRAVEVGPMGRPRRILVDFCSTRQDVKFAV